MSELIAKKFFHDKEVTKSLAMLLEKLQEYRSHLSGVKAPESKFQTSYDETIKKLSEIRGGNLYYPYLASGLGHGTLVELEDGSVKYDFIIGIGVHLLGHSHPKIIRACLEASLEDTVMQGHLQQSARSLTFSKKLVDAACAKGAKLKHCFLTSTGVMADENAIKMIFQKKFPRDRILAFEKCFMGRTLALSQVTDKAALREGLPLNVKIDYVPFFDDKNPEASTEKALQVLRCHLARYPKQQALMSFELVQGEAGFYPGSKKFFTTLMEELKKNDIAILVDEVQTFGRTSEIFAFQHFELDRYVDLVAVGKATQVCATLFTEEYKPRPGLLSQTFTSSSVALAAGEAVLDELLGGGYYGPQGKVNKLHDYFENGLKTIEKRHPKLLQGPYGIGAMIAITPFGGAKDKVTKFTQKLYQNGLIGFIAGAEPTRTRFLIPIGAITTKDIDAAAQIIEKTLIEVSA